MGTAESASGLTARSPQHSCDNHHVGATVDRIPAKGLTCSACLEPIPHPMRDNIPMSVWLTLADNEDSQGRVPADPQWAPK